MQIRPATVDDASSISTLNAEVQELHAQALPHIFRPPSSGAFPPGEVAQWFESPSNQVFLACEGGVAVGYIWASLVSRPETSYRYAMDLVYINHLVVQAAYRRKGVGQALVEKVMSLAREKGISMVQLDVWSFNEQARAFFQRQGFTTFNERMWIGLDPLDATG